MPKIHAFALFWTDRTHLLFIRRHVRIRGWARANHVDRNGIKTRGRKYKGKYKVFGLARSAIAQNLMLVFSSKVLNTFKVRVSIRLKKLLATYFLFFKLASYARVSRYPTPLYSNC